MRYSEEQLQKKEVIVDTRRSNYVRLNEENPVFIGKFLRSEEWRKNIFAHPAVKYFFDNGEQEVSLMISRSFDKRFQNMFLREEIYKITYTGKTELSRGRRMNNYVVERMIDVSSSGGEDGEE